jgi:CBS domain-containing protein
MTAEPRTLPRDASVTEAVRMMKDQQFRRVPVVDGAGTLVGILSLGDLADAGAQEAEDALEAISTPAQPDL